MEVRCVEFTWIQGRGMGEGEGMGGLGWGWVGSQGREGMDGIRWVGREEAGARVQGSI